jgi:hypothetical protein
MMRLLIILALAACSKEPAKEEIDPLPVPPDYAALHDAAYTRLTSDFLDQNEVVSRKPDGSAAHQGDSLLFSGLLIASVKCDQALETEQTLQRAIMSHGGQLWRHWSIDDASVDGAIGLFRGIAERYARGCQSFKNWKPALEALKAYADANNGAINHNSSAGLDTFAYVLDLLLDRLAGGVSPDFGSDRRAFLAQLMGSWVSAVHAGYKLWKAGVSNEPPAAYRVHLALLTLETLGKLGVHVQAKARDSFCHNSQGFDMPTTDHYCGRKPIGDWVSGFQYDIWEFRHQRSGLWESDPDGNGYRTPAVDLLYGIAQGYEL